MQPPSNHPDARIEREHPAPFSFTDVARLVRFFTKKGQTVLDPFAGVGSTLKACATEGRKGIGFELNPRYAELARERMAAMGDPGAVAPWGRLGGIFEDRVARALASMGMPTAHELALLTARVEALERAINRDRPAESAPKATRTRSAPSRKSSG